MRQDSTSPGDAKPSSADGIAAQVEMTVKTDGGSKNGK